MAKRLSYIVVDTEEERGIMVFRPEGILRANQDHPHFETIHAGLLQDDVSVLHLFEADKSRHYAKITERVAYRDSTVYFDLEPIDNLLAEHILQRITGEVSDLAPLVNFLENVETNPDRNVRERLYEWVEDRGIGITVDGLLIAYTPVDLEEDGFKSINDAEHVVADGQAYDGVRFPYSIPGEVEVPRSSYGLTVGSREAASDAGFPDLLRVHVDPRDVTGLPPSSLEHDRILVCRLSVREVLKVEETSLAIPHLRYAELDDCGCDEHCSCYAEGDTCCDCGKDACKTKEAVS